MPTAKQHLKSLKGLSTEKAYQYIIDNLQGFEFEVPQSKQETIDYATLVNLQGTLKDLEKANFVKLVRSFLEKGFFVPLFVWQSEGVNYVFDGHQRHGVLSLLNAEPKQLPFVSIYAKDKKDAKEKLLLVNSQYGKMTKEGFDEFTFDLDFDFLNDTTTFEGFFDVETTNIDLDSFFEQDNTQNSKDQKFTIVLEYTEKDYNAVIEAFKNHSGSKEQVVFKLLGI